MLSLWRGVANHRRVLPGSSGTRQHQSLSALDWTFDPSKNNNRSLRKSSGKSGPNPVEPRMDATIANSSNQAQRPQAKPGQGGIQMARNEFFAGLFLLGCANGIATRAVATVHQNGWLNAAIGMFDVSAIVLAACASGLWLIMGGREQSVTRIDLTIGVVALALIALPLGALSWIAVSGIALYILLFADTDQSMRRGAVILLATTVPMFWSRLFFQLFANLILEIDASLVGWLLGADRTGNMVRFVSDSGYLVIMPPCSSLANMSLAFLCWITVSEFAGHRRVLSDLWWCLLACGSVLVVNVGRLSAMGISVRYYEAIHNQIGSAVTDAMILTLTLGWSFLGVRRELFSRA
jgi:hypothetical protein